MLFDKVCIDTMLSSPIGVLELAIVGVTPPWNFLMCLCNLNEVRNTMLQSWHFLEPLSNFGFVSFVSSSSIGSGLKTCSAKSLWLFVVWMGLKTLRIVFNEMKPSFKP